MTIQIQSSRAQDQTLGVWFQNIEQGRVKLPRFQRPSDAWDRARVTSFLNTIIRNLPVGVTLVLDVSGPEKFPSRFIETSKPKSTNAVTQHLLDGQQRLTSFWRAMHNNFENETYYFYLSEFDTSSESQSANTEVEIRCQPRWKNKRGDKMPRWADEPAQCLSRGLFPVSLLRPGDHAKEIEEWRKTATAPFDPKESDENAFRKLKQCAELRDAIANRISVLRERITHFNLPFLSLPASTEKDVALQVFINMNTNSKPLAVYDIVVAEVESVSDESLHDLAEKLSVGVPKAVRYGAVEDLILSTAALLQNQLPNSRGMLEMNKRVMVQNWDHLVKGLERMADFLEGQGMFDEARLPTNAVLAVIAAAYNEIPEHGDFVGKAEKLLRRYLWSSFFTDRYENSAPTRAFADYKSLKALLQNKSFTDEQTLDVPVLNRNSHSLPDAGALLAAGWPKSKGIEARAVLAVTTLLGAIDFADGHRATYENLQRREYHHVFPDALLKEATIPSSLALNCALVTWKTNRIIGRQDPLDYMKARVEWASEADVKERLKSHLISYTRLSEAQYKGLEGDALKAKLAPEFEQFLVDRAELVLEAMQILTSGDRPTVDAIWTARKAKKDQQDTAEAP